MRDLEPDFAPAGMRGRPPAPPRDEDGEYSYPSCALAEDGSSLHVSYTFRRETIRRARGADISAGSARVSSQTGGSAWVRAVCWQAASECAGGRKHGRGGGGALEEHSGVTGRGGC